MIDRRSGLGLAVLLAACAGQEPASNTQQRAEANAVEASQPPQPAVRPGGRAPLAFTSLKPEDCQLIERNLEEAGYARHRCTGIAGYALETSESDLRHDILVIGPDRKRTELGLSAKVAKGAFNTLGERAEWRGANATSPSSLIVRLGVAAGADPSQPDISNLVVVRLGLSPCIVAVIPPGPNQNEAAQDVADAPPAACI